MNIITKNMVNVLSCVFAKVLEKQPDFKISYLEEKREKFDKQNIIF